MSPTTRISARVLLAPSTTNRRKLQTTSEYCEESEMLASLWGPRPRRAQSVVVRALSLSRERFVRRANNTSRARFGLL
eukprot:6173632-Pleurochrysis_carterae.AAC.7